MLSKLVIPLLGLCIDVVNHALLKGYAHLRRLQQIDAVYS